MDKRPSIIGKMFDRIAPTYDRLNTILSFSVDKSWRKATIRSLQIHAGDTILDVATGTGDLALLAACQGGKVVGIDLSGQMLLRAVSKARKIRLDMHYTVVKGDALSLPFRDETFKSAMVAFGIRNVDNMETLLGEIYRVLNPHGRFAVLEFSVPEKLLFRWIYMMYLKYVLPVIGGFVSGDHETYRYLRDSVIGFPTPTALEGIMEGRGFRVVQSRPLFGGVSHLYLVEKP